MSDIFRRSRRSEQRVEAHSGTPIDYLRRHEREAARLASSPAGLEQFAAVLRDRIADPRNLMVAIKHIADEGGQAPGPNGLCFSDFDDAARWRISRELSKPLKSEEYRPGKERQVKIPKGGDRGTRTISLLNIEDRAVQRAVNQIIQPVLERGFSERSFGYCSDRDRLHALSIAEALATQEGRWFWIAEDIRDAFDNVPHGRLLNIWRQRLPDDKLADFLRVIIGNNRRRGLRQGGALSPLLLNLYLDHFLDRPWGDSFSETPLLRVADDLLVLCRDRDEADAAYAGLKRLLAPAGMPLKGSPATTTYDLRRGEVVDWLGFRIARNKDRLVVRLSERSWFKLADALAISHEAIDAPLRAEQVVEGWLSQQGPCYADDDVPVVLRRIRDLAAGQSFLEIPGAARLREVWQAAYARWQRLRNSAAEANQNPTP